MLVYVLTGQKNPGHFGTLIQYHSRPIMENEVLGIKGIIGGDD